MRTLIGTKGLFGVLGVLLVVGFTATSLSSFFVSRDALERALTDDALPLTGDTIFSEIQRDLLRPVFISSLMAHDTFVRDWLLSGEQDQDRIVRYLREVKERYGTITSFLVSDRTGAYYYADGKLKVVSQDDRTDAWFFRVRALTEPYETNVDADLANRNTTTIFINYRILDYDGRFLGATGVGLTTDTVSRLIADYQRRYQRRIYFVDHGGSIVLSGAGADERGGSIREHPGMREVADAILDRDPAPHQLAYERDATTVHVNARYITELGWHLVVEQDHVDDVATLREVLLTNLAISAAVTLLVIALTLWVVRRFQRGLEQAAAIDPLTGLLNRQAFDFPFAQAIAEVTRSGAPMCVILADIDHFKRVNDEHGHLAGDRVLATVASALRGALRASDLIARWGGEEFIVVLKGCPPDDAVAIAEKLRAAVTGADLEALAVSSPVTISLGVACHAPGETPDQLFQRADQALYLAKQRGRDRTERAAPPA
ncbi:MAG: hypothetical protein CVU56_04915 [Deltaproteobacteria bacterium HGW-Deltaproteobacteria-14]|nr:MAG: hypothetical protein CVU56_04915 [Deltaproteobacteria bacterium HGW-Deltaproteobacteria-14]